MVLNRNSGFKSNIKKRKRSSKAVASNFTSGVLVEKRLIRRFNLSDCVSGKETFRSNLVLVDRKLFSCD